MVFDFRKKQPREKNKPDLLSQLKERLVKTRSTFGKGLASLLQGKKQIDEALLEDLETLLLTADVGVEVTSEVIDEITQRMKREELSDFEALKAALSSQLTLILNQSQVDKKPEVEPQPKIILVVGINGAGKTTTIGKLAWQYQKEGKNIMLAAGDTFRAAAVEQLQAWGKRNQVPVIAQHTGADSASVIYDAVEAAKARGIDILLADTAGRLHTKDNLMDELRKIVRVIQKIDASAPHEIMLVIDGSTGQNALQQAIRFNEAVPITSLIITKLDGTAKGGIVFAISDKLKIPVSYIGIGEGIEDLYLFNTEAFIKALFSND